MMLITAASVSAPMHTTNMEKNRVSDKKLELSFNGERLSGGVQFTFSWKSVEELLRANGNIKPHEILRGVTVEEHGIAFHVDSE